MEVFVDFIKSTGFALLAANWKSIIMILITFVLFYLAIVKKFEPLLLLPIAFGMLLTNLPGANIFHEILFAGGHIHWDLFGGRIYKLPQRRRSCRSCSELSRCRREYLSRPH